MRKSGGGFIAASDKENYPLVSVVIPVYNAKDFIGESIDSVRNQDYQNWELLVVDDGSTDKSRDIVFDYTKLDPRIRLINLAHNSGTPGKPRNVGIKNARGKYISFLDADDLWVEEKLSRQVYFLEQNENVFLLYSRYLICKNGKVLSGKIMPDLKRMKSGNIFKSLYLFGNFISTATVMFRNRYEKNYLFAENPCSLEDLGFWLKISKNEIISYIEDPLSIYRLRPGSDSSDTGLLFTRYLTLIREWRRGVGIGMMCLSCFFLCLEMIRVILRKIKRSFEHAFATEEENYAE